MAGLDLQRIQAVVFDMDDTLLNWRQAEHGAIDALARMHFSPLGVATHDVRLRYDEVMAENYASWKATRRWWYIHERLGLLVSRLGLQQKLVVDDLAMAFAREVTARLDWLDGGLTCVRAARSRGWKTALLTNGRSEVQRPKVHAFNLHNEVDFVGITGELGFWKPDAAAFNKVLAALGVPAKNTLMVGDNLDFDITPAKALGWQTAWVSPQLESHPDADVVVASPGGMLQFFGA